MPFPAATPSPLATTDPPARDAARLDALHHAADRLQERASARRAHARAMRIEADDQDRVAAALDVEAARLRQEAGWSRG